MGNRDQTSNNQRSNQTNKYASVDKEGEPTKTEPLHISNTEVVHLVFEVIEKQDVYILTKQFGYQ